jgi:UDP-glucose 4-epimerase
MNVVDYRDISGARVLVVGGAGFIGSHLVDLLVEEDVAEILVFDNFVRGRWENLEGALRSPRVRVIEGDIRDFEAMAAAVDGVDFVFHLAALWLLQCAEDPRAALEVNVVGTFNVLAACRAAGVKRLVFSSSASVYGDMVDDPMTEDHPFNNRTMYGATKIAGEQLCHSFAQMYGVDWVGLRYFNVYGPRQDYRGAYVAVMMKALDRIDAGLPPIIFGDGSQSYDFVYVGDVARANLLALKGKVTDQCFNVATGRATPIRELVDLILELTGSSLEPEYRLDLQTFVTHRRGSTDRAARFLGFRAGMDLRDGMRRLIEWRRQDIEARPLTGAGPR